VPILQEAWARGDEQLGCFDTNFSGFKNEKSTNMVTNSYGVDTTWYTDTGMTDHITWELEKLTIREKYHGHDQVHTASGAGINSHFYS
jgi:hypothetical protein